MSPGRPRTGELAVLVDGPWAAHTYWRHNLVAMQEASRALRVADHHPSAVLRNYHGGEELPERPEFPGCFVRAWHFRAPSEPPPPAE